MLKDLDFKDGDSVNLPNFLFQKFCLILMHVQNSWKSLLSLSLWFFLRLCAKFKPFSKTLILDSSKTLMCKFKISLSHLDLFKELCSLVSHVSWKSCKISDNCVMQREERWFMLLLYCNCVIGILGTRQISACNEWKSRVLEGVSALFFNNRYLVYLNKCFLSRNIFISFSMTMY